MIKIYKCKRCGHEWAGRLPRPPKVCPGCNSPYWNKVKWKGIKRKEMLEQGNELFNSLSTYVEKKPEEEESIDEFLFNFTEKFKKPEDRSDLTLEEYEVLGEEKQDENSDLL